MSEYLKGLFGGQQAVQKPVTAGDGDDFADFAGAPEPSPGSILPSAASSSISNAAAPTGGAALPPIQYRPYTKWYRVWERVTLQDFYSELFILPFILIVVAIHVWGTGANRRKARRWAAAHVPVLRSEFALVGFEAAPVVNISDPMDSFKQKSAHEYTGYATGRQNVAFMDYKLNLAKRYNPMGLFGEMALGFLMESMAPPPERVEATSYVFDGQECLLLGTPADARSEKFKSSYDGFVFAVVHKERMKQLRDGRYDLSLTTTKDNAKLPAWATVMSESAEITDTLLTPELIQAVKEAGEALEALIITDMPVDKPNKLAEATPKKRVSLFMRLNDGAEEASLALFRYFIRLPDMLAGAGRFRPEALRRVKATREDEIRKIKKLDDDEKALERRQKVEKEKHDEREKKLRGMSAEEQRKFLERERALEMRRGQKKMTKKG